jgi:hypothetical protein
MSLKKLLLPLLLIAALQVAAQQTDIKAQFKNPPTSAWPRAWWHWTNGNITKDGITKDLEWMKRVGIQGMQLADVASGGGQTIPNKLAFGSPEWLDAVKFAASEADRLNLEMTIFTSAGWSLTGGPWVKPEQAMKKLVWSETRIEGAKSITIQLPEPPSAEGAGPLLPNGNRKGFYRNQAVIAFRTPGDELAQTNNKPVAAYVKGPVNIAALSDDNLTTGISIPTDPKTNTAWLILSYNTPLTAKAITIAGRRGIPFGKVLASNDGIVYHTLTNLPGRSGYRGGNIRTYAFPETTAKYFRIDFTNAPIRPADVVPETTTLPDTAYQLTEIKLQAGARVNRWEDKAGFNFLFEYDGTETPASAAAIKMSEIIDLTANLATDGTLTWDAPAGNWTIMRFGYALTGSKNRPAVPSGLGYEVDKMSKKHVTAYMDGYTAPLQKALGPLYGKSLQYMIMDSWEAGIQNWTDEMPANFMQLRGYNILPYLPVLAGHVVESADASDRFLWDFRRTLVDLIAVNHYGTVTDYLNKQGLKTYGEAGGVSLESIEDALLNKKYVDIPMGEFWVKDLHPPAMYYEDMRGAASAAHIYGKNIVAAEAYTGGGYESPNTLRRIADYWFTQGVNRLVFHTSAHQPLDSKPGNTMVGTHINRNITWAELARSFMTYIARNSYMMQQGMYTADVVYLLNEGAPSTMPFWSGGIQPAMPEGYSFDYINTDALLTRMQVDAKGKLVLPDGMHYSVLVLPPTQQMTLPVLRKIQALVQAGATVVGPKPIKTPGLAAYPTSDTELADIANDVWADLDGQSLTARGYGKGKIFWGQSLQRVLNTAGIIPDVNTGHPLSEVSWIHRNDAGKEIYLLVNRTDNTLSLDAKFRTTGKAPQFYHADTGEGEPAPYTLSATTTAVPIRLAAHEAVYVLFEQNTSTASQAYNKPNEHLILNVKGPWQLQFPAGWGAPKNPQQIPQLNFWTLSADTGIRYFSGTATYTKTITVKPEWVNNKNLYIDLGNVGDIAVLTVNGGKPDTLWKDPYRAKLTNLRPGNNTILIKVTNEWNNRIAGDKLSPEDKRYLTPGPPPFGLNGQAMPLSPSGLSGPVKIIEAY